MFLLGKPFLMRRIHRVKVKGTGVRARSNPEQEPDFWAMPWVGKEQQAASASAHHITSLVSASSSCSVVSHEDLDSSSTTSSSRPASPLLDQVTSRVNVLPVKVQPLPFVFEEESSSEEDDLFMTGWGKPFYFLDSLPEEVERATTGPVVKSVPASVFFSNPTPSTSAIMDDFMDLDWTSW
jgi:hypothetical protein